VRHRDQWLGHGREDCTESTHEGLSFLYGSTCKTSTPWSLMSRIMSPSGEASVTRRSTTLSAATLTKATWPILEASASTTTRRAAERADCLTMASSMLYSLRPLSISTPATPRNKVSQFKSRYEARSRTNQAHLATSKDSAGHDRANLGLRSSSDAMSSELVMTLKDRSGEIAFAISKVVVPTSRITVSSGCNRPAAIAPIRFFASERNAPRCRIAARTNDPGSRSRHRGCAERVLRLRAVRGHDGCHLRGAEREGQFGDRRLPLTLSRSAIVNRRSLEFIGNDM